jgi:hypothetical protein
MNGMELERAIVGAHNFGHESAMQSDKVQNLVKALEKISSFRMDIDDDGFQAYSDCKFIAREALKAFKEQ